MSDPKVFVLHQAEFCVTAVIFINQETFFSILIKIKALKVLWNQQASMRHNPCLQGMYNPVVEVRLKHIGQ